MSRLQDVAKRAGVSVSTVSNVVNGRTGNMKPDNLQRVQDAIEALGYRPNRAARFLKTGQTPLIGLLVPSISNPIFGSLAREVEDIAQEKHGYRVLVGNTYRDPQKEKCFLDDLISHGIRGVIIVSPSLELKHFEESIKRGLIGVSYDRRSIPDMELEVDYVSIDNFKAAHIAVDHLVKNGHRRLAYITPSSKTNARMDKIDGFLAAVEKAYLSETSEVIEVDALEGYGDAEMAELGMKISKRIMARKTRPTGIVAMNDIMAAGFILSLQRHGVRVPEDISVVGIDDMFLSAIIGAGITSVKLPLKKMAKTMVNRIIYRLNNPHVQTEEFIFMPQLVLRGSVATLK
jgi:DNA-binding LacI/PurR family transcriptional regulator